VSEPEEDFAAMFEASQRPARVQKGQIIEGTVVSIGAEVALVDVGSKSEATIARDELTDDDGNLEIAVGDRIQAMVVSTAGALSLSRRLALGAAGAREIQDAFEAGLPVEGKVQRAVKGGYEVRVGRQRAFCPVSHIDLVRNTEPAQHEGRVYRFRIIESKDDGRNVVLSRRVLLEEQQRADADDVRRSLVEGAVLTGRVVSVRDFGAFVDLGSGVQGLLHVSEMSWSRVADPAQVVQPGDEITVRVLRIDPESQKIALGLKQVTADPWSKVEETYQTGQVRSGRVTRTASFGVFVELEPGVEGLVPASETGVGREVDLKRTFPAGTELQVVVAEVDPSARRMRLSVAAVQQAHEAAEVREYAGRAEAAHGESFGSLADKLRGALDGRRQRRE
jgi:small subunit ribosomal protein S1